MPLKTLTRQVPDETGGWYWLRKGPRAEWEAVYVQPATATWPACLRDEMHGTGVEQLPEDWEWREHPGMPEPPQPPTD